jgi:hypothetical protein
MHTSCVFCVVGVDLCVCVRNLDQWFTGFSARYLKSLIKSPFRPNHYPYLLPSSLAQCWWWWWWWFRSFVLCSGVRPLKTKAVQFFSKRRVSVTESSISCTLGEYFGKTVRNRAEVLSGDEQHRMTIRIFLYLFEGFIIWRCGSPA